MSDGYDRGVVVDEQGFFVAALRWEAGTPAPKFNKKVTKGGLPRLILLRDPYAIENVDPSARWDFTPVREDGVLVRAGTWLFPTEERWIVNQRRDRPYLWSFVTSRLVWPERLPRLPEGQKLVDVAPPKSAAQRPVWDDRIERIPAGPVDPETGEPTTPAVFGDWRLARRALLIDENDVVLGAVASFDDDDVPVPPNGRFEVVPRDASPTGTDETGDVVPVNPGDVLASDGTVTIRRLPDKYRAVPVRLLEQVLTDNNLGSEFVTFVQGKGYTIEQVRSLGTISLRNKLLREFVTDQGLTMQQAYNAL